MVKVLRQLGSLAFVLGLFVTLFIGVPWHVITSDNPVLPLWLQCAIFCVLGGVFVVLLTVALEQKTLPKPGTLPELDVSDSKLLILNTDKVPGRKVSEILGVAQGHTVFAIWIGNDLSAIMRLILGGELTEYADMMGKARSMATARMIAHAEDLGADAIINLRYTTTSVIGSAAELLVYGTAVKLN